MPDDRFWRGHPSHWDEDPRVVDPMIMAIGVFRHLAVRGAVAAWYAVRGQWSDVALDAICHALSATIPQRYSARAIRVGVARFVVYLGTDKHLLHYSVAENRDHNEIDSVLAAAARAFNCGVEQLTGRRPAETSIDALSPLDPPPRYVLDAYLRAQSALGEEASPSRFGDTPTTAVLIGSRSNGGRSTSCPTYTAGGVSHFLMP